MDAPTLTAGTVTLPRNPRASLTWLLPPLLLVGAALLVLVSGNNLPLFFLLRRWLVPAGAAFWSACTLLGDALVAPLLIIPFLQRRPQLLWESALTALFAALFTHGLKPLVHMPRPAALFKISVIGPHLYAGAFPSGHTTTAFAVLALLLLCGLLRGRVLMSGVLVAALVGLSRIAVGAHWPADVLTGAALGWLSAILALGLARRWPQPGAGRMRFVWLGVLIVLAFVDLFGHDTGYPQGLLLQHGVALAALTLLAWQGLNRA